MICCSDVRGHVPGRLLENKPTCQLGHNRNLRINAQSINQSEAGILIAGMTTVLSALILLTNYKWFDSLGTNDLPEESEILEEQEDNRARGYRMSDALKKEMVML